MNFFLVDELIGSTESNASEHHIVRINAIHSLKINGSFSIKRNDASTRLNRRISALLTDANVSKSTKYIPSQWKIGGFCVFASNKMKSFCSLMGALCHFEWFDNWSNRSVTNFPNKQCKNVQNMERKATMNSNIISGSNCLRFWKNPRRNHKYSMNKMREFKEPWIQYHFKNE